MSDWFKPVLQRWCQRLPSVMASSNCLSLQRSDCSSFIVKDISQNTMTIPTCLLQQSHHLPVLVRCSALEAATAHHQTQQHKLGLLWPRLMQCCACGHLWLHSYSHVCCICIGNIRSYVNSILWQCSLQRGRAAGKSPAKKLKSQKSSAPQSPSAAPASPSSSPASKHRRAAAQGSSVSPSPSSSPCQAVKQRRSRRPSAVSPLSDISSLLTKA